MSRADRPYGMFHREGGPEPLPAPAMPITRRRRVLGPLRGRRGALLLLAALAGFAVAVGALGGRARPVAGPAPTAGPSPSVQEIYAIAAPSVVSVRVGPDDPMQAGSGVVIDEMGTILTAAHVLGSSKTATVTFADGTQTDARVLATVPENDIAVLGPAEPPPPGIVPAVLGDPSELRVGDGAYVIGDPLGLTRTYTVGVISGLDRTARFEGQPRRLERLIQFDAAVDPGSSGGPLLNGRGEVVGIVTGVVAPEGGRGFAGLGFAVRIDVAGGALGQPVDALPMEVEGA